MWYVIQVMRGHEEAMASLISRVVPKSVLEECFYPQYATEMKVRGAWVPAQKPLFPGYLIGITGDPATLERHLLKMNEFARVLSQGDVFVPLAKEEVALIGGFTRPGDRVVPMSLGFKDGDRVIVSQGPLKGHEGLITDINRRKSTAYLSIDLCGRKVSVRMGLGVLRTPTGSLVHASAELGD